MCLDIEVYKNEINTYVYFVINMHINNIIF